MPQREVCSVLAVDIGSCRTKASLFDVVEGQHRFIASGEALTSLHWPIADASVGVRQAIEKIERVCGRTILEKNGPVVPESVDGTGVDFFTTTTTAGGSLRLLTITSSVTCPSFQQLKSAAAILGVETEDVSIDDLESAAEARQSTIASRLRAARPNAIFVTAQGSNSSLATLRGDLVEALRQSGLEAVPVRFAGQAEAADTFMRGSADSLDVQIVRSRGDGGNAGWNALELELLALWRHQIVENLPGFPLLLSWQTSQPQHSSLAFGDSLRFLANYFKAHVVGLDIGASHVSILDIGESGARATTSTQFGVGRNAISLLSAQAPLGHETKSLRGVFGVPLRGDGSGEKSWASRWLPLEMSPDQIDAAILNKSVRPWTWPETRQEAFFERALGVESVQRLRAEAKEGTLMLRCQTRPGIVVGTGSIIINQNSPGRKALTILDALEPAGVFEVAIDRHATMAQLGDLARTWPQAAAEAMLGDSLEQLGICVAAAGQLRAGAKAATLEIKHGNTTEKIEVAAGQLRVVPLPNGPSHGKDTELTIKPHGALDFGWGKGKTGKINLKSAGLGLIVDTRGRPIVGAEGSSRKDDEQVRQWIESLELKPNT